MKLEHQVCSLDLAKQLKELGVKQESHFYWFQRGSDQDFEVADEGPNTWKTMYSAFTVAELADLLPSMIGGYSLRVGPVGADCKWGCWYENGSSIVQAFIQFALADACARMLIYLIDDKIMRPTDQHLDRIGG